jgi:hypothetical protein
MGVNYQQKCMVGIEIPLSDITIVVSEAVYEDQNRYNPKTGKITGTEKVLVKEEELKYVFMGKESTDWYSMIENLADELGIDSYIQDTDDGYGYFCLGTFIGDEHDMGRADLLEGSVPISHLVKLMTELKETLGDVQLHFLSSAG